MAVPFPRSSRALSADSFRYTLMGLAVAGVLLIGWCVWFFGATVTFMESSSEVQLGEGETLVALFPKDKLSRIARDQHARFFPDNSIIGQAGGIPVVVAEVNRLTQTEKGRVIFLIMADRQLAALLPDELSGRIDVEVERVSPAQLVMRSSGLGSGTTTNNTTVISH